MADTKLVGDIAVQHAILEALERGWGVSVPVGDRLPYDLIIDVGGGSRGLFRCQVKSCHKEERGFAANTRRCKTNRKRYRIERYGRNDFDFALLFHPKDRIFYVVPIYTFLAYRSAVRISTRRAQLYRNAWNQLEM